MTDDRLTVEQILAKYGIRMEDSASGKSIPKPKKTPKENPKGEEVNGEV